MGLDFRLLIVLFLLVSEYGIAQEKFCRVWFTENRDSKVKIIKESDGKYYAQLVWIKDSLKNGKPLIDTENPDKSLRNRKWLGIKITNGMVAKSPTELVDGKIYDPSRGNHYHCKIKLVANNIIELRGYILGISWLGRTTRWYLAE